MLKVGPGKLVRDKIATRLEAENRILTDEEFKQEILHKLIEVANEVRYAITKHQLIDKLAELTEVEIAIHRIFNITEEAIEEARMRKYKAEGGYENKVYLKYKL